MLRNKGYKNLDGILEKVLLFMRRKSERDGKRNGKRLSEKDVVAGT